MAVHSAEAAAAAVRSVETEAVPVAAAAAVGAVVHLVAAVHPVADLMAETAVQVDRFSGQGPSLYQADQGGVMDEGQVIMAVEEETPDVDAGQS